MQEKHSATNANADGSLWQADEQSFLAGLREGKVGTYRQLLEREWQSLVAYAYRMLGSQDAAEDAVQEAFVSLWQRRSVFRPKRSVRGYLFGIVRNVAREKIRKDKVRQNALACTDLKAATTPTPADITELGELEGAVTEAIEDLPERRREVFCLAQFSGLSHREIGEALGVAPSTAKKHMNLALRDLRRVLEPYVEQRLGPRRP